MKGTGFTGCGKTLFCQGTTLALRSLRERFWRQKPKVSGKSGRCGPTKIWGFGLLAPVLGWPILAFFWLEWARALGVGFWKVGP
jgi:hypothetical protein